MAEETMIGVVADFFARPVVAAIELTAPLKVGDRIHIKGHTTDLEQSIDSIQIEHAMVPAADKGADIGVKVKDKVRQHDEVFKVVD